MEDFLTRFWTDLVGRTDGPMSFRFFLQPMMAALYAARDGIADARAERPPYFWRILTQPGARRDLLREGWAAVLRVILLGTAMDLIYQLLVLRGIHPVQTIVIVLLLAFLPYVLLRGPANRIARAWRHREGA